MTDKPKESAEEIVNLIISNTASQYSEEWKPDIVYTKEELIKIVKFYAQYLLSAKLKEKEDEFFVELCVISIKKGREQKEMLDKLKGLYAPSPPIK